MLTKEEQAQVNEQIALSRSLALGLVWSLFPAAGIGSVVAIWIGVRGLKKIDASGAKLVGTGMAKWCIALGIIGLILNAVFLGSLVFRP